MPQFAKNLVRLPRALFTSATALLLLAGALILAPSSIALAEGGAPAALPPTDRDWTPADYPQAAAALEARKTSLPRFSDPAGRAFLQSMTSRAPLARLGDGAISLGDRLGDLVNVLQPFPKILGLYQEANNAKGADLRHELAMLMGFLSQVSVVGVSLTEEFEAFMIKKGGDVSTVQALNQQMIAMFDLVLDTAMDRGTLAPSDLSLLLNATAEALPGVKRVFPAGHGAELRQKIEAFRKVARPQDRPVIQNILRELDA